MRRKIRKHHKEAEGTTDHRSIWNLRSGRHSVVVVVGVKFYPTNPTQSMSAR